MKMKKMRAALAAMTIVALTFTACSGDDGAQGPAGPAGTAGADGVDGADGADGNANVQGITYTIASADWANGTATVSIPELTTDIARNGQVVVYWTTEAAATDTTTWNPLPFRFVANVGGTPQFITVQNTFSAGQVTVSARLNSNAGVNLGSASNLRVVLIPSTSLVEGVDVNNYEEVKMVYGIKEYELN